MDFYLKNNINFKISTGIFWMMFFFQKMLPDNYPGTLNAVLWYYIFKG